LNRATIRISMTLSSLASRVDLAMERFRGVLQSKLARGDAGPRGAENLSRTKLNLGCGDKILPGYTNVDISDSQAKPDVVADLRKLPFPDDYADEVLSIHVIEHFYQWEVSALLAEWIRVLKPGGVLILECPNLLSAARFLLASEDSQNDLAGPSGQRSTWAFYGDPSWKEPLMCHRWGYTPQSLMLELCKAGLKGVQHQPARYKLPERDMRIVGFKQEAAVHPLNS
jgi:SAM-dependent methyltransferase